MRIAMVVHSYYPADVRVRRECEALSDRGDTVDMICLQKPGEPPIETVGNVEVRRLPVQHRVLAGEPVVEPDSRFPVRLEQFPEINEE